MTWVDTIDEQRHKVQLTMIDPNKQKNKFEYLYGVTRK